MSQLEFELIYSDVAVQYFNHYTTGTSPINNSPVCWDTVPVGQ